MKRIGIFVDVSNIYGTLKNRYNRKLDYGKLLKFIDGPDGFGEVIVKIAYGADISNPEENPELSKASQSFKDFLEMKGFKLKYKTPKRYNQSDGRVKLKADHDVTIAIDMVRHADKLDRMILCCADGDLVPAVDFVQAKGLEVIVLACNISKELAKRATESIEIPAMLLEDK